MRLPPVVQTDSPPASCFLWAMCTVYSRSYNVEIEDARGGVSKVSTVWSLATTDHSLTCHAHVVTYLLFRCPLRVTRCLARCDTWCRERICLITRRTDHQGVAVHAQRPMPKGGDILILPLITA